MSKGFIAARVFTSRGAIPIAGAAVSFTVGSGAKLVLLGFRTTNEAGGTTPISLVTPDEELSQAPSAATPFAICDIRIDHPLYYTALVNNVQVFAGTVSQQEVELLPLAADPAANVGAEIFTVEPQNL